VSTETRGLARIARAALRAYGIAPARLRLAGASFNSIFHVVAEDGRHLAVRVGPNVRIHPEGCEEAEAAWLERLANAGAPVNRAVRTLDGGPSVVIDDGDAEHPRSCMVFDWAPGRMLQTKITAPLLVEAGRLCAELHEIAMATDPAVPPHGVPIGDRVVYFAVPDRLSTLRAQYGSLFDDARDRAQATLDRLWQEQRRHAHLLHGDFTPANIVVHRGSVRAIDFQDMLWGLEVQDLAMAIAVLRRSPEHAAHVAAFRSGYERRRPWPDIAPSDMEDLIAVRRLSITNLNVAVGWPNAAATIERHADMIRDYLH
jgi:Ser/Thr protein kinase RdoA (MazF antagonist)